MVGDKRVELFLSGSEPFVRAATPIANTKNAPVARIELAGLSPRINSVGFRLSVPLPLRFTLEFKMAPILGLEPRLRN